MSRLSCRAKEQRASGYSGPPPPPMERCGEQHRSCTPTARHWGRSRPTAHSTSIFRQGHTTDEVISTTATQGTRWQPARCRCMPAAVLTFPGESDTGLCDFPVCLFRGDVTDSGVDRPTIVIGLDGREQVAPRGIAVGVFALLDEFGFQGAEDALDRRVVPAVWLAAHRWGDGGGLQGYLPLSLSI